MGEHLSLEYDRSGDIFYITKVAPYREQETREIGENILARTNPETGDLEGLEILFWSRRLISGEALNLPITADFRIAVEA